MKTVISQIVTYGTLYVGTWFCITRVSDYIIQKELTNEFLESYINDSNQNTRKEMRLYLSNDDYDDIRAITKLITRLIIGLIVMIVYGYWWCV